MATGIVKDLKLSDSTSPFLTSFTRSFSSGVRSLTTATQASYPAIPVGYYGVFTGFSTNNTNLLMNIFDANAAGSDTLLSTMNVRSSAVNNRQCNFYSLLIRTDLIQDERNL